MNRFVRFDFRFARRPLVLAKRLKKVPSPKATSFGICSLLKLKGFSSVQVEKIASLDKKNKKNKNFCHLGKRGRLIKNAKAWKKRHKNRQMMEHKIMLLVRVNVFNSTHPTKRNFSIIICFMLFAEWLLSKKNTNSIAIQKKSVILSLISCRKQSSSNFDYV